MEEVEEVGDSGFRAFKAHWKAGRTEMEGVHQVIVRAGADGEELVVPVRVRDKEG